MKVQWTLLTTFQSLMNNKFKGEEMATIRWLGFQKEPRENFDVSYELITGQNLKPSSKKRSKKQPGKPIEVFYHQVQAESITPDEIDENNELER